MGWLTMGLWFCWVKGVYLWQRVALDKLGCLGVHLFYIYSPK